MNTPVGKCIGFGSAHSARGDANLLLLAEILEAADAVHRATGEPTYSGASHEHDCGTPACALAHWYAYKGSTWLDADIEEVLEEFGLTHEESIELFGPRPCGDARTAADAAAYIRGFVKDRDDPPVNTRSVGSLMACRAATTLGGSFREARLSF